MDSEMSTNVVVNRMRNDVKVFDVSLAAFQHEGQGLFLHVQVLRDGNYPDVGIEGDGDIKIVAEYKAVLKS